MTSDPQLPANTSPSAGMTAMGAGRDDVGLPVRFLSVTAPDDHGRD